ncbi:thioredoxin-like protein [Lasiosphaeria hispida]|uniref:Thioredoxin-like protein n=1 Tax=Lasiosphaeria hispida TaxID=260671 RepID=A0AAJ0HSN9_9PEZI|nr:thioredoxin-like protein [Lasiosphaeria hispida]
MTVHTIPSEAAFEDSIKGNKIALIDIGADWCPDCRAIDPIYQKQSENDSYKDVFFAKMNVDELKPLSASLDIRKIPTFLLYKDGVQIARLVEPKQPKLLIDFIESGLHVETFGSEVSQGEAEVSR